MSDRTILDGIGVAKPCPASWDEMEGDDRVRFCGGCRKQVYNITALTMPEAIALLSDPAKPACVQFYRRADGTVLTSDCPVGAGRARRSRLKRLAGLGLVGAAFAFAGASALLGAGDIPRPDPFTPGSGGVDDWIDWALVKLHLRAPSSVTRGEAIMTVLPPTNCARMAGQCANPEAGAGTNLLNPLPGDVCDMPEE